MAAARSLTIRRTTEDDWRQVRDLRLEALEDTPHAFGETVDAARTLTETEWRARGARGGNPHGTLVAAIDDETGDWVGTMGGYLETPTTPMLVGVYVTPTHRGSMAGVTDALLDTIEEWARTEGDSLTLHVHEANPRAIAFYTRRGYESTGVLVPYVLDPTAQEIEMRKPLAAL
ncbi:GNAT family N-acetyltransferase [Frigoribacterium sp. 2-23]|uniref:GNAT family N-acetyltransferase n=1 Tax=Frigoribacterium sp. 2-23 TaxID=3415006 RepID=UPI003C7057E9